MNTLQKIAKRLLNGTASEGALAEEGAVLERLMAAHTAHEADQMLARRRVLVAEIAQLHATHTDDMVRIRAAEVVAAARVEDAWEALRAAMRDQARAAAESMGASNIASNAVRRREGELLATAPPAIEEFIAQAENCEREIRRTASNGASYEKINPFNDARTADSEGFRRAERAILFIRALVSEARVLQLEALADEELEERLAALDARLRAVDQV